MGMNKFKIGDRAVCYDNYKKYIFDITGIDGYMLIGKIADGKRFQAHYKQCRRLVKKKRRELWVNFHKTYESDPSIYNAYAYLSKESADKASDKNWRKGEAVKFIEAKK